MNLIGSRLFLQHPESALRSLHPWIQPGGIPGNVSTKTPPRSHILSLL